MLAESERSRRLTYKLNTPFLVLLETDGGTSSVNGRGTQRTVEIPPPRHILYVWRAGQSSQNKTVLVRDAPNQSIASSLCPVPVGSCSVDVDDDVCEAVLLSRLILRREYRSPQKIAVWVLYDHYTPQRWLAAMQIGAVRRKAGINSHFHVWLCRWQRSG